ncbi:MAG: DUF4149 domain-containing protein [Polyangiaceae bacterium]
MPKQTTITLASQIATVLAVALWLGGMIILGAVVAPVVFSVVPAPISADAMTVVFRRFDALAVTSAAVVLVCEMWRVKISGKPSRRELSRGIVIVIAGLLALFEGVVVSPRVEALHRAGAVRGLGDLGKQLDSWHSIAEAVSKCEAFFIVAFVVLYVVTTSADRKSPEIPA